MPKLPTQATGEIKTEVERMLETIPTIYKGIFQRAIDGTASPRGAIKAKCQECVGYEDTRSRIKHCDVGPRCALWKYRPYQDKVKNSVPVTAVTTVTTVTTENEGILLS